MKRIKTLKKNYEFKNVLKKGQYYIGKQIIVYLQRNKQEENRIGIAINTKMGKAVKRNYAKRLIRAAYQQQSLQQGYNIVFLWNKKVLLEDASFLQILKDMEVLFDRAGIIRKEAKN